MWIKRGPAYNGSPSTKSGPANTSEFFFKEKQPRFKIKKQNKTKNTPSTKTNTKSHFTSKNTTNSVTWPALSQSRVVLFDPHSSLRTWRDGERPPVTPKRITWPGLKKDSWRAEGESTVDRRGGREWDGDIWSVVSYAICFLVGFLFMVFKHGKVTFLCVFVLFFQNYISQLFNINTI